MAFAYILISLIFMGPGTTSTTQEEAMIGLSELLAGSWFSEDGKVEEHWLSASGGLMLGLNRNAGGKGIPFFEFLRIELRADGIYYVAQPKGGSGTAFKMVLLEKDKAVFENPQHDFPQVITYSLQGKDQLCAAIGTLETREKMSWCWQRGSLTQPKN